MLNSRTTTSATASQQMGYPGRQNSNPPQGRYQPPYTPSYVQNQNQGNRGSPLPTRQHGHPYPQAQARPMPVHFPATYPAGPLGFFLPPPGQITLDPTLNTPPRTQARFSTYPSRLRTGVTGLVQPDNITGGPKEREKFLAELDRELFAPARSVSLTAGTPRDSPAPGVGGSRRPPFQSSTLVTASGRRGGRAVNYADNGSDEEDEDEDDGNGEGGSDETSSLSDIDEPPSDPDDTNYAGRGGHGGQVGRPRKRDKDQVVIDHQTAMRHGKLRKKKEEMDKGWTWLGDRAPAERVRAIPVRGTAHEYLSQEVLEEEAKKVELLVPITIDLEISNRDPDQAGIRIRDRFLWNLNETHLTPYQFAKIFCEDIAIPVSAHAETIANLIQAQIEDSQGTGEIDIRDEEVGDADVLWNDEDGEGDGDMDGGREDDVLDGDEGWKEADCRIIINLDVQIYTHILRDRIEWDLSSSLPPATFAAHYSRELGLSSEAIPLITHAIMEEIIKHKRDCLELELFATSHPVQQARYERTMHGNAIPKVTHRHGAMRLKGIWRDWWEREEFGPVLVELSMEEMERREAERNRETRRMMRGLHSQKKRGRGRGRG